jgi:hypothetical protein
MIHSRQYKNEHFPPKKSQIPSSSRFAVLFLYIGEQILEKMASTNRKTKKADKLFENHTSKIREYLLSINWDTSELNKDKWGNN